jgi:RNA polymerase sigma factor (sigma-70 family)
MLKSDFEDKRSFLKFIYETYVDIVINTVKFRKPDLVEDITHDVFLKFFTIPDDRLQELIDTNRIAGYLITMAKNKCTDDYRKHMSRGGFKKDIESISSNNKFSEPDLGIEIFETSIQRDWILKNMTPKQREVMELILDGFTNKEIAERLDYTVTGVANLVYRAKKKINKEHFRLRLPLSGKTDLNLLADAFVPQQLFPSHDLLTKSIKETIKYVRSTNNLNNTPEVTKESYYTMKHIPFEEIVDYIFNDLPLERQEEIESIIKSISFYQDVIYELNILKTEFDNKEKLKKFFKEKRERVRKKLFPE